LLKGKKVQGSTLPLPKIYLVAKASDKAANKSGYPRDSKDVRDGVLDASVREKKKYKI
jgi:hypothetical protein